MNTPKLYWVLWYLPDGRECAVKVRADSRMDAETAPPPALGARQFATWLDACHAGEPGARFGLVSSPPYLTLHTLGPCQ